jgi:hypothetical protein
MRNSTWKLCALTAAALLIGSFGEAQAARWNRCCRTHHQHRGCCAATGYNSNSGCNACGTAWNSGASNCACGMATYDQGTQYSAARPTYDDNQAMPAAPAPRPDAPAPAVNQNDYRGDRAAPAPNPPSAQAAPAPAPRATIRDQEDDKVNGALQNAPKQ